MDFIKYSDLRNLIQDIHLSNITLSNPLVLSDSLRQAEAEISSYLRNRFDLSKIFKRYQDYSELTGYAENVFVWFETTSTINAKPVKTFRMYRSKSVVPVEILPTNTTYWEQVDDRHPLVIQWMTDVTLYHIHSAIEPKNIPDLRVVRYKDCISTLKGIRDGLLSVDLPELEDQEVSDIPVLFSTTRRNSWFI